jgi:hypothetical protein
VTVFHNPWRTSRGQLRLSENGPSLLLAAYKAHFDMLSGTCCQSRQQSSGLWSHLGTRMEVEGSRGNVWEALLTTPEPYHVHSRADLPRIEATAPLPRPILYLAASTHSHQKNKLLIEGKDASKIINSLSAVSLLVAKPVSFSSPRDALNIGPPTHLLSNHLSPKPSIRCIVRVLVSGRTGSGKPSNAGR